MESVLMDYQYQFENLFLTSSAQAARLSVLWPVLGAVDATTKGQLKALSDLLVLWRTQLSALWQAGYRPSNKLSRDNPKQLLGFQYMRNCTPFMASVTATAGRNGRYCKLRDICPWCYGRRVAETYLLLQALSVKRVALITAVHQIEASSDLKEALTSYSARNTLICQTSLNDCGDGAISRIAVEPTDSGFVLRSYVLISIKSDSKLFLEPATWTTEYLTIDSAIARRKLLACFMRYPAGLLKGDPAKVNEYLSSRVGYRLYEVSGSFRGAEPPVEDPLALNKNLLEV